MQALKSLFSKKEIQKESTASSMFDHNNLSPSDDISQCPYMKNKQKKMAQEPMNKCPQKGKKEKNPVNKEAETSSDEEEIPKGGCPFMGGSEKKRNPDLFQMTQGFDEPFVSKYSYYLSSNKIDFAMMRENKGNIPVSRTRQVFNNYPIYLQHTLMFTGEDYKKVRGIECCSRFMPYDKLREKGNKYFNKGKYAQALQYYQRSLSLFKWLQHVEETACTPVATEQLLQSSQSIQTQSVASSQHIRLNLKTSHQEFIQKQGQFDEMREKYKEFFIVYNDSNVRLCDGKQMDQTPDIDMRKSLMLQLYINMAVTYMKLNHFSLALRCISDAEQLSENVSQVYLRKAQILLSKGNHSIQQLYQARQCAQKAIQMKKSQKIFQSNQNILKMVNLHNAGQYYQRTLDQVNCKIVEKQKEMKQLCERIYKRAQQIHSVQLRLISQGKTPYQRNQQPMSQSKQFKILMRMKQKYVKVIQFYSEAQNKQQVQMAKVQLQKLLQIFSQMSNILRVNISQESNQLGGIHTQKVAKRIQTIKKNYCQQIYNKGKYNYTVMEWAIKQIIKEQNKQEQLKKKEEMQTVNGSQGFKENAKAGYLKYASWGLVVLPVLGFVVNTFLLA